MYKTLTPSLTEQHIQKAKILVAKSDDLKLKKKAFIDFLSAFFAIDFFQQQGLRANCNRSIFYSSKLYSDFEMVDIYCNSHRVCVLATYGNDIVKIPYFHKTYDILPEAYVVVDIKAGMKEAEIKGVIFKEDVQKAILDGKYFKFDSRKLRNLSAFYDVVKKYASIKSSVGRHLDCIGLFEQYINGNLSDKEKNSLIAHILSCDTCKKKLIDTINLHNKINAPKKEPIDAKPLAKEPLRNNSYITKEQAQAVDDIKADKNRLLGAIDVIYKGEGLSKLKEDAIQYKTDDSVSLKIKRISLIISCAVVLLVVFAAFAFNLPNKRAHYEDIKNVQGVAYNDSFASGYEQDGDLEVAMPKVVRSNGYTSVSKVSWEVASNITNNEQKMFLQTAGKSIRLNLQNDLLLSSEIAVNNKIKFDLRFLRDGVLDSITVVESSGTRAVDDIIKQSIENTLYYMRPPKNSFVGKKNSLTLVVDF